MFLKRERPETDDIVLKTNLVVKEKYYFIFQSVLADTLTYS